MADPFTVDPSYFARLFQIEGGGDPYAPATGSNRGMGQFSPDLEARYGITDQNRTDPAVQTAAVQQEVNDQAPALRRALGRDPTPGELYLAHQQGIGGALAHLGNPDQPAWQSMLSTAEGRQKGEGWARAAIAGNPFTKGMNPNISSGDFARGWINKFQGIPASMAAVQAASAPLAANAMGQAQTVPAPYFASAAPAGSAGSPAGAPAAAGAANPFQPPQQFQAPPLPPAWRPRVAQMQSPLVTLRPFGQRG